MRPAFFSVILIAVHASVLVDCAPRLGDAERRLQRQQGSFNAAARAETSAGTGRLYLGLRKVTKGTRRHFLVVILPARTDAGNFLSIFDLTRKRFVCMDSKGHLHNSRQKDRQGCLFQHIRSDLEKRRNVLYSVGGGRLLRLEGSELQGGHQESPPPSSALVERLLAPLVKRHRRSQEVNPSDPLRSQSHPSPSAKEHRDHRDADPGQREQDQAGAVAKETISSCDDPLRVLQANGSASPVKTNIADRAQQD